MTSSARARISLGAIRHNLEHLSSLAPAARVMAVVKGNAYGHGMIPTAKILADVDCLAVARLSEARQLRRAGIERPLVLLGGATTKEDHVECASLDVALCVHNKTQIDWLDEISGPRFVVWLKVDTGMNRLGFGLDDVPLALDQLKNNATVKELRVMTHFANADLRDDRTIRDQIERFRLAISGFEGDVSLANSAALLGHAEELAEFASSRTSGKIWIRPGIALYGVSPMQGESASELGLQAAMQFESRLIAIKSIRRGDRVGYGGTWEAPCDSKLGVVAIGYGDGYSRAMVSGSPVLINARQVTVVGVVSMDLTTVDLGAHASDRVGDRVILWGDDLPVESVAKISGVAAYQLVTGVLHRESAVYY